MPGQRSKNKTMVGGFIPRTLKNKIKQIAKAEKKSVTQVAVEFFEEGVERWGRAGRK